jgi:hypothetical protein
VVRLGSFAGKPETSIPTDPPAFQGVTGGKSLSKEHL